LTKIKLSVLVIQHNPLFWWVNRGSIWTSFSPRKRRELQLFHS